MHPIEGCIRSPIKVSVGVLLVALFGFIAAWRMPMQLTPEVQIPTINIETRWPGASPMEIEREIIQEQEEQLKGVEGVVKMSSESMDSTGRITLEFLVGSDMQKAVVQVNSQLEQVPEYPIDADKPVVKASSSSDSYIAWFILSPSMPSDEKMDAFVAKHPELRGALEPVRKAFNPALAMRRLRDAAEKQPELAELLPTGGDVTELRKFSEDVIEAAFERVGGVANANVVGGLDPECQVIIDPQRLAARSVTIGDLRRALESQNADISAGDFWEGKRRYIVRTLGQFRSPEAVGAQIITTQHGNHVYVRDVADVQLGFRKPDGFVRRYGTKTIALNVQRETGANVLEVMRGLRAATEKLNAGPLAKRGLSLSQVYDETDYIYSAVGLVTENIIIGGALTMVVLMLFLHLNIRSIVFIPIIMGSAIAANYISPWLFVITLAVIIGAGFWYARGALVVGMAIPASIIGTFLILNMMGRSLNVISLAGLAFAVGMLVDNAVVVLENIYRRYDLGESPFQATFHGTAEVWGAVVASTLTTLAVFLPVLFIQEEAGQLFRDIALAISAAIGLSLIVSVTVVPAASARLLRERSHQPPAPESAGAASAAAPVSSAASAASERQRFRRAAWIVRWLEWSAEAFVRYVVELNRWVQGSVARRIGVVVGLTGASLLISWFLRPTPEYLPTGNRNLVICSILPPTGYNLDELERMGREIELEFEPLWNFDPGSPELAKLSYPPIEDFFYVARGRQVFLGLRSYEPTRAAEYMKLVREKLANRFPGTICVAFQSSLFGRGLSAGRTIDIEINGPELERLVQYGGRIMRDVMDPKIGLPTAQARPVPSLDLSSPEVQLHPRYEQAAEMGVSAADLGYAVNALVDGAYASDYFVGGDKIDLVIKGRADYVQHTQDLNMLTVSTPSGQLVPLSAVASLELSSGPEQVNHRERQRCITIQVVPPPEISLADAIDRIETNILKPIQDGEDFSAEYSINLSGAADKLYQTWLALRWNLVLALLITYLLMAALFESWVHPFVIIFSVPLGAVGGVVGLWFLNGYLMVLGQPPQALDVITMLGFIILIGTVVNNAILIVHQSLNHMREDHMLPVDAILESVRTRIRPIFMTTVTTVFGLAPLVLFPGAGSELYRGLGSVVLGGLLASTMFTLVLIPALFSLMLDLGEAIRRRWPSRAAAEPWGSESPPDDAAAWQADSTDDSERLVRAK